jgi:hypothetical protein
MCNFFVDRMHPACFLQAQSLPKLLAWVKTQLPAAVTDSHVSPDWSTIIAAGHSRGGWIAFKQLQQDKVVTAMLLDAVAPPGAAFDTPADPYLVIGAHLCTISSFHDRCSTLRAWAWLLNTVHHFQSLQSVVWLLTEVASV